MYSQRWGDPDGVIQIASFSVQWPAIRVYWVDENSMLVFRASLSQGDRHFEKTSVDHTWVIVAVKNNDNDKKDSERSNQSAQSTDRKRHNHDTDIESLSIVSNSLCLILRPCITSVLRSKPISIVWVPHRSVTLSPISTTNRGSTEVPLINLQIM